VELLHPRLLVFAKLDAAEAESPPAAAAPAVVAAALTKTALGAGLLLAFLPGRAGLRDDNRRGQRDGRERSRRQRLDLSKSFHL
jgi:hypothetical protein